MDVPRNYILGISAFFHDSAGCLLSDGQFVAAAQEERFSRRKHDATFPLKGREFLSKRSRDNAGPIKGSRFLSVTIWRWGISDNRWRRNTGYDQFRLRAGETDPFAQDVGVPAFAWALVFGIFPVCRF